MIRILPVLFCLLLCASSASAQRYVRYVYLDKRDVFDSTQSDWFFGARLVNALHVLTRDYVIYDEVLVKEGDELNDDALDETERNLRRTGLFTRVRVYVDSVAEDSVDVTILTQDKWSTAGAVLFGSGGGTQNYGGSVEEQNLAGIGLQLGGAALYRTENDIGWQGILQLNQRRLARSEFTFAARVLANRIRTEQGVLFEVPFRTLNTRSSYFLQLVNTYGDDFLYTSGNKTPQLLPFHVKRAQAMYSRSSGGNDRYFGSALLSIEDVQRIAPQFRQAFDNTGKVLVSVSSLRQNFIQVSGVNGYEKEDIPIGAWGMAVLGYMFPMNGNGERAYYVGGMAEQSGLLWNERIYLYGHAQGASGFYESQAKYTYFEAAGIGNWRISPFFVLAARFRGQTSWNWNAYRQLVLDNDAGLRGYTTNGLAGDNRFIANLELRAFPDVNLWIFRLGGAVFYDVGAVWNQANKLSATRFHNALGIGVRIINTKASGGSAILRLDAAYNFDEQKFGLVFSSDQLFSAFGKHMFRAPQLLGTTIDNE
ncbi:MAG: hypothetical protein K1X91_01360 [Bacteriodetes bacterium]|nr:hypothetical protein [Bacteroidota bacterium]